MAALHPSRSEQEEIDFQLALQYQVAESGRDKDRKMAAAKMDKQVVLNYTDSRDTERKIPVNVAIRNARPFVEDGTLTLKRNGFTLVHAPTKLKNSDFYKRESKYLRETVYYDEMEEAIKRATGADKVFVFAHQVRNNSKKAEKLRNNAFAGGKVAGYASVVHSDYCAKKSVEKFYKTKGIPDNVKVRYMLINCWRNTNDVHPIYNNTLCVCDTETVDTEKDFVRYDVPIKAGAVCTDGLGGASGHCAEQYRMTTKNVDRHRWYYFPHMRKDEVLLFTQFDSDTSEARARFCFHSAFSDVTVSKERPARESMEVRAMALFLELDESAGVYGRDAEMIKKTLVNEMELERGFQKATLQQRLASGAAKGLIRPEEVPRIAEEAALERIDSDLVVMDICARRGIEYNRKDWDGKYRK
jgi:hypothetical protein|eukprot:g7153.t1